jgi:hypothetical protein
MRSRGMDCAELRKPKAVGVAFLDGVPELTVVIREISHGNAAPESIKATTITCKDFEWVVL